MRTNIAKAVNVVNRLSSNKYIIHCLAIAIFIFIAFFANNIQGSEFIAGGDFIQPQSYSGFASSQLFSWSNTIFGQGNFNTLTATFPYYYILGLLQDTGLSAGQISNLHFFLFLYVSFLAYRFGAKSIFSQLPNRLVYFGAFAYALNPFTLTVFTYPWGYNHHFLIYPLIPLIIGSYYKLLVAKEIKHVDVFKYLLILLLSQIAISNFAFLASVILLKFSVLILLLVIGSVKINMRLTKRLILIIAVNCCALLPLIASNATALLSSSHQVGSAGILGDSLGGWITSTSNNFLNVFMLVMDNFRFPWSAGAEAVALTSVLIIPLAVIVFITINKLKDQRVDNNLILWLSLFIIFSALAVRVYSFLGSANLFIYQLPFFNAFRSPDKIFVLLPYLYITAITAGLMQIKLHKAAYASVGLLLVLLAFPFFNGTVLQQLAPSGKLGYGYITTIPQTYREVVEDINTGSSNTSILSLPYSVVNSIGWSNYPKWGYVGSDPIAQLYEKMFVTANMSDNVAGGDAFSFKEYNDNGEVNREKFLNLLQKFSVEYILWHKDINLNWSKQSITIDNTLAQLAQGGEATVISDNDYFTLYKLNEKLVAPIISSRNSEVVFSKISPVKYKVELTIPANSNSIVTFNQTFNDGWQLLAGSQNDSECSQVIKYSVSNTTECVAGKNSYELSDMWLGSNRIHTGVTHSRSEGINEWEISQAVIAENGTILDDGSTELKLTIFFRPQSLLQVQHITSIFFIALSLVGIVIYGKRDED